MKLIIGLGNPGKKYDNTRHNVGFMVLDKLKTTIFNLKFEIYKQTQDPEFKNSKKLQAEIVKIGDLILAKPTTFMNLSGVAVRNLISQYRNILISKNLYVVHDDLDIKLGDYKIEFAHGPLLHNGIASIETELATKDFWRVRIGVDNRSPENRIQGEEYVLQEFTEEEKDILNQTIEKTTKELTQMI